MRVGTLVKHRLTGEIGVITHTHVHPYYYVKWADTLYSNCNRLDELEVLCEKKM